MLFLARLLDRVLRLPLPPSLFAVVDRLADAAFVHAMRRMEREAAKRRKRHQAEQRRYAEDAIARMRREAKRLQPANGGTR